MWLEVSELERLSYNHFIAEQEMGSFLQSWDWGDWQQKLSRQVLRLAWQTNGQWQGMTQLVKMPLPFGRHYWYTPYGPVFKSNLIEIDFQHAISELKTKLGGAVFIRIEPKVFNPALDQVAKKSHNIQPGKTLQINLKQSTEDLLSQMHPKTRYNIKLAQKHGVRVSSDWAVVPGHGLYFQEVLQQILETQDRQRYHGHAAGYYKNLVDFFGLKPHDLKLSIYKALYQGQLLACAVMVDFGASRTYLFGGSSDLQKNLMAPYLMHWQAMQDAKTLGLQTYDFWGLETSAQASAGFARFKLGFGGASRDYAGSYDVICQTKTYRAYELLRGGRQLINKFIRPGKN